MPAPLGYASLPHLLHELQALTPRLEAAAAATPAGRLSPRLLAHLLALLHQLPALALSDRTPPLEGNFMPPLTVRGTGTAYLSRSLIEVLRLRAGQPAALLPPRAYQSPYWYLDLRPSAAHNINWYPGKKARIRGLSLREDLLLPGQQQTLLLVPGEPEFAGIYPLLPDGPPTTRQPLTRQTKPV